MRIKPLLVSTAFISTLFATTALAPDALAQKGAVYTPQTDWAITKVEGANGYCALARRFDRNTILTIARNKMSEASLALDFQRPKFQVGQTVHVVLDPGAGQQRSYDASPASANAFVLRLGQDAPFFGALKKTGYLRAEIAGKSYSFNLADIDAGQDDLSACVVSMTQPAAGDVDITPAPTFGGSKAARTRALESENETLRLKLASVKSADAIPSAASNQNVARLQAENARLQSSLNLAQGNASATQQLQAEIAALRAQNENIK